MQLWTPRVRSFKQPVTLWRYFQQGLVDLQEVGNATKSDCPPLPIEKRTNIFTLKNVNRVKNLFYDKNFFWILADSSGQLVSFNRYLYNFAKSNFYPF